jgi:Protein of unknown function (DUF2905)
MHPGKLLILVGSLWVGVGLIWLLGVKLSFTWHLPGDIEIKKEGFSFYFPLGTCLLLSLIISLLLWLFRR